MPRGRPSASRVRQNLVEILYFAGEDYAYNLFRIYRAIFPSVSMRLIYYHLKRGLVTGEFEVSRVTSENGDYSWGSKAEKVYYKLGSKASPVLDARIKSFFDGK